VERNIPAEAQAYISDTTNIPVEQHGYIPLVLNILGEAQGYISLNRNILQNAQRYIPYRGNIPGEARKELNAVISGFNNTVRDGLIEKINNCSVYKTKLIWMLAIIATITSNNKARHFITRLCYQIIFYNF
jgi:hypothetical protein